MYRSRPVVLVILAATAACSTRDDSAAVADLATDTTLARLSLTRQPAQPLPAACGAVAVAAKGQALNKPQAKDLARQAYRAELLGRLQEAQSLLRRASDLDDTDQSLAYHLGRTSESLGDRGDATRAYCRYLSLTSNATGAADARDRLARLSLSHASAVSSSTGWQTPARGHSSAATYVASRSRAWPAPRTVASTSKVADRDARSERSVAGGKQSPAEGDGGEHPSASDGDVIVAASAGVPTSSQPATAPSPRRRGPTRVQGAGIGAVAGAIIGAATGHTVKSAVIGSAVGGILGTVVAGASQ